MECSNGICFLKKSPSLSETFSSKEIIDDERIEEIKIQTRELSSVFEKYLSKPEFFLVALTSRLISEFRVFTDFSYSFFEALKICKQNWPTLLHKVYLQSEKIFPNIWRYFSSRDENLLDSMLNETLFLFSSSWLPDEIQQESCKQKILFLYSEEN